MKDKDYKIGVFYGTDLDTEDLAKKFVGHLINNESFCKACEEFEENVECDNCREDLKSYSNSIYFFDKVGENIPSFVEEPEKYLPEAIPPIDYLLVVGIHPDLLAGLPNYMKGKDVKAVIIPIESPKWVPPGLQMQVLEQFEEVGIQAAFPKPYCSLSKKEDEYNKKGVNKTKEDSYINEFIDYFQIGKPIVSFKLTKDGEAIEDTCVIQSAPCGSSFYVVQQLKGEYYKNGKIKDTSLNEKISQAHHSYPCNASMDQDSTLKDSILHVGGYLIRNAVRRALDLEEEEGPKLKYVIK